MVEGEFNQDCARALKLREKEAGVLVCNGDTGYVDRVLIDSLKRYASGRPNRRARVLFHKDERDGLQEMLIAACQMTIWPPHINDGSAKSWTVLDGVIAFVQYTPPGTIVDVKRLSSSCLESPAFFRLSAEQWHTIVPLSEMPVYLETRAGPQRPTRFAEWGPQSNDDAYADQLREAVRSVER